MAEIDWKREKSWEIKDEFPITVFVEKSVDGSYYRVKVPAMKMCYETWGNLDLHNKVDISSYDYTTGEGVWTSYTLDNIKEWSERNKEKIIVDYSKI